MPLYTVLSEKYWTGERVALQGEVIDLPQAGLKGSSLKAVPGKGEKAAKGKPEAEPAVEAHEASVGSEPTEELA